VGEKLGELGSKKGQEWGGRENDGGYGDMRGREEWERKYERGKEGRFFRQ